MHSAWNIVSAQWVFSEWIQKNARTLEEINRKQTNAQVRWAKEEGESGREYKENATGLKRESNHAQLGRCKDTSCKSWYLCWSWRISRILTSREVNRAIEAKEKDMSKGTDVIKKKQQSERESVFFNPVWLKQYDYISRGRNHARN